MLPIVKSWFESIKKIETKESDWGVESNELWKEELDSSMIPAGIQTRLTENLLIDYYYYSSEKGYYVVYCLPLKPSYWGYWMKVD